ncbi:hypothetical protein [Nonomuraea sp. NPDC003709]|uniref:hypothetical protein n=1 Tax=Nonomuraea sp. NPDC003709 TaxID=3154450 RepID=UPI0033AF7A01
MPSRTWMTGEASLSLFWDFLAGVTRDWRTEFDVPPWRVDFEKVPTACTVARYQDPSAGKVTVGVALRPGQESEIEWGMVGEAEHGWTCRSAAPWARLGFIGEGFCDASGAYLDEQPAVLPVDFSPSRRDLLEAMMRGFNDPHRSTGLLVVAVSGRKSAEKAGHVDAVCWPGVLSVALVTDEGRAVLNRLLPSEPIPAGGARFYPAPGDELTGVEYTRTTVRTRPEVFTELLNRALRTRASRTPAGAAAPAARLLEEVLHAATSPQQETLTQENERLQSDLSTARQHNATLQTTLERARRDCADARREVIRLARLLPGDHGGTERDLLAELLEPAEDERDQALRDRGLLTSRLHAARLDLPDDGHDDIAAAQTFPALIEAARRRYDLLDITADPVDSALLDAYPKAATWRRKTADATGYHAGLCCGQTAGPRQRRITRPTDVRPAGLRSHRRPWCHDLRQQVEQAPHQPVDKRQQHLAMVAAAVLIIQQNPSSEHEIVFSSGTPFTAEYCAPFNSASHTLQAKGPGESITGTVGRRGAGGCTCATAGA